MRIEFRGKLTFELHGKGHTAAITGVTFSTAVGKHQYTTNLVVHYRGNIHEAQFSYRVDPGLNEQQRAAYLERLYAERVGQAAATWPSPWPNVQAILIEIGVA